MDAEVRGRVEALCAQLSRWPSVRETIAGGGAGDALDALMTLLRDRAEPDPARVEALLDAIDRAAAQSGLAGLTSGVRGPVPPLPRGIRPAPGPLGWTCPLGRCSRVVLAGESTDTPVCAAAGPDANGMTPYVPRPGTL
ncbi:hypothetical protein ACWD5R_10745 [Streptomyces sp. NPDC002514]|uniref:hypothetical protein n=1 Tax=Streptomyces sp. NPDC001270 TaxID=3364554 RepID=UPI0036AB0B16